MAITLTKLFAEPDILFKITSYVRYVDIENLQNTSSELRKIFKETEFWERKLRIEFPKFDLPRSCPDPLSYVYWQLKYFGHYCDDNCYNICNNCNDYTHCFNITHCCPYLT